METTARQAIAAAEEANDAFAAAGALGELWLSHSVRRNHLAALDCIERACACLGTTLAARTSAPLASISNELR